MAGNGPLDALKVALQYPLPQHALSRAFGRVARCRWRWFRHWAIRRFVALFRVDLAEAAEPSPESYCHFDAFFTRALKPGARPLPQSPDQLASPVDGTVSQAGTVDGGRVVQAKGRDYSVEELLGGDPERAAPFQGGRFTTLYLSPRDYHRIHLPLDGTLRSSVYVPGRLFSVNPATTARVPRLFARNERLAAIFETPAGPMAVVMVGALLVAGIETVWSGWETPPRGRRVRRREHEGPHFGRGDEIGRFHMGSTVILLLPPEADATWEPGLVSGTPVRMGQPLARLGGLSG
ncbi:MAG: archaetidylserine decarboxylase [Pseudomonadota bacterium]